MTTNAHSAALVAYANMTRPQPYAQTITPKLTPDADSTLPRVGQFAFDTRWFTAMLLPYGLMAIDAAITQGTPTVTAIRPDKKDTPNLTACTVPYENIASLDPETYVTNITFTHEWFASILLVNGWNACSVFSSTYSAGRIIVRALTGCDHGSQRYDNDVFDPVLPLSRAEADAQKQEAEATDAARRKAEYAQRYTDMLNSYAHNAIGTANVQGTIPKSGGFASFANSAFGTLFKPR